MWKRDLFLLFAWLYLLGISLGMFFPDVLPASAVYRKLPHVSYGILLILYLVPLTLYLSYLMVCRKSLGRVGASGLMGSLVTIGILLTYDVNPALGLGMLGLCGCVNFCSSNLN